MLEINWMELLAAFGAGLFGAAIGALPAFIFTGFAVLVGVALGMAGGAYPFLGNIAFGPVFGPHIAFGGGVAAAAFAARQDRLGSGRDIATALAGLANPSVLLVGGLFGAGGYVVQKLLGTYIGGFTDTVALTVVISAVVARLLFGKTGLFGTVTEEAAKRGRWNPGGNQVWAPYMQDWGQVALLGAGIGLMSAWISLSVAEFDPALAGFGPVIGFGISATSLLFAQFGVKVPITHHMTLIAGLAAVASGSLLIGVAFGLIAALVGEFSSRLMLIHGDTHIDPPAMAIWMMTLAVILIF